MKITGLRTILVDLPGTTWIVSPDIRSFGCALIFLDTDKGITGESFIWTFGTAPHIFAEESMHVVAAVQNATYVERIDWFKDLYEQKIEMKDGKVVLPDRPGFGFTFSREATERYRVDR